MHKAALQKASFNQVEAKEILKSYVGMDRRFDEFDPDRLAERIFEAKSCGRTMDLTEDTYLRRGGEKRPLSW
jgi:hypothetical protein